MHRSLKINVLGRFQAQWDDGEAVDISSKKALALLTYLAVESGPRPREVLANLLWGGTGDDRARHNLRQALSKIRHCCDSLIVANGDDLSLDRACDSDVARFEELARSKDSDELRECLDLYRGELLEGLNPREPEYADWLMMARAQLRDTACRVADRLGHALIEAGRVDDAINAFRDLLAVDAAHEPAHSALMSLYVKAGRRSDALRQFQACGEALQRELGVEPSAETREIYEGLRKGEQGVATENPRSAADPAVAQASSPPAIAVLPFENLSSSEQAYFADGMAEDLITALSCFHSLVVIARGSSYAFRNSDLTDQAIARELGAQYLVRGSVQREGKRVRINVQLLDAEAGLQVWGHRYDREMEDVFVLQDEITSTLVSTLAGRVEAARLARARKAPAERLDAHDLLLRGKDHHHRFTPEDCEKCIDLFERAVEQDPDYAVAYAWLGCGLGQAMVFELDDNAVLVDRCQSAVEKGLSLDENDSECHRVLAQVNLDRGDLKRSLQHQERALFLNPNDDRIVNAMGEVLVFAGRAEEAEQWVRKSMRLNPYHPIRYWTHLVRALFHQGRFEESLDLLDRIDKQRRDDLTYKIAALERMGESEAAKKTILQLRDEFPEFDPVRFVEELPFQNNEDRDALLEPVELALT
jgi:TolB-like protein/Tfp pilus assembly protein PilF